MTFFFSLLCCNPLCLQASFTPGIFTSNITCMALPYSRLRIVPANIELIIVPSNLPDLIHHFGRPSFFLTITANPHWEEISRELFVNEHGALTQSWCDRPDLVSRVFK